MFNSQYHASGLYCILLAPWQKIKVIGADNRSIVVVTDSDLRDRLTNPYQFLAPCLYFRKPLRIIQLLLLFMAPCSYLNCGTCA